MAMVTTWNVCVFLVLVAMNSPNPEKISPIKIIVNITSITVNGDEIRSPMKKPTTKIINPCMVEIVADEKNCPAATLMRDIGDTSTSFIKPDVISSIVDDEIRREKSKIVLTITPASMYVMGFSMNSFLNIELKMNTKKNGKIVENINRILSRANSFRFRIHKA
jgi:hypothetical protein